MRDGCGRWTSEMDASFGGGGEPREKEAEDIV